MRYRLGRRRWIGLIGAALVSAALDLMLVALLPALFGLDSRGALVVGLLAGTLGDLPLALFGRVLLRHRSDP